MHDHDKKKFKVAICIIVLVFTASLLGIIIAATVFEKDNEVDLENKMDKLLSLDVLTASEVHYQKYTMDNEKILFSNFNDQGAEQHQRAERHQISEMSNYISDFYECNSTYFKQLLNEKETIIYNAILWAFDHSYCNIFFPEMLWEEVDFNKIFEYAQCDSPLIDANTSYEKLSTGQNEGVIIKDFSPEMLERKKQAVAVAKETVASVVKLYPDSEFDRTWVLYSDYVESASYLHSSPRENYLYDGMILKRTNCDGVAESIGILFNLAGIDNIQTISYDFTASIVELLQNESVPLEALYSDASKTIYKNEYAILGESLDVTSWDTRMDSFTELLSDNIMKDYGINLKETEAFDKASKNFGFNGHTWNIANVDGKWHNFDGTTDQRAEKIDGEFLSGYYGGFAILDVDMCISSIRDSIPKCELLESPNYAYTYIEDINAINASKQIADELSYNVSKGIKLINIKLGEQFEMEELKDKARHVWEDVIKETGYASLDLSYANSKYSCDIIQLRVEE